MCKELFKDRGKLNEKKMRVDVGRGGGGRLTSNVSRFTMWKNVLRVLGHSGEQDQEQSWKWPNRVEAMLRQTHRSQPYGIQAPALILPLSNLAQVA